MGSHRRPSTFVFVSVIASFTCRIMLRLFTRQVLVKRLGMNNAFTAAVLFDAKELNNAGVITNETPAEIAWDALYPFQDESSSNKATVPTAFETNNTDVAAYALTVSAIEERVDEFVTDHLPFGFNMIEVANKYDGAMQWDYAAPTEYNAVITTSDGYLMTAEPRTDVTAQANATISFGKWCEDSGVPFAYISTPVKTCKEEEADLSDTLDFCN